MYQCLMIEDNPHQQCLLLNVSQFTNVQLQYNQYLQTQKKRVDILVHACNVFWLIFLQTLSHWSLYPNHIKRLDLHLPRFHKQRLPGKIQPVQSHHLRHYAPDANAVYRNLWGRDLTDTYKS